MSVAAPSQAPPGYWFATPGNTQWTERKDNNDQTVTTLNAATTTPVNGLVQLDPTGVVLWWELEFTWANTWAAGGGSSFTSIYFPFVILGESSFPVNSTYPLWHIQQGIDAAIFQLVRPMRGVRDQRENLGSNPPLSWGAAAIPQANLDATVSATTGTASILWTFEVPAGLFFDAYWDLTIDGTIIAGPMATFVSPRYMSGSGRSITPNLKYQAGLPANTDLGPFVQNMATPTFVGSTMTLGVRRVGLYQRNNPAVMPVVYNWQIIRDTYQVGIAGVSKVDIPVPQYGQILLIFVRLFDPSAASGGAPIALSGVSKCQVLYSDGLLFADDTARSMQRRILRQHGFLPPNGVMIWDFGIDHRGRVSNGRALNTLNTAGVKIHLEFSPALSATAYCVVGVEALGYVQQ